MARMDRVLSLDTHAAVVQCQSGCTLQVRVGGVVRVAVVVKV